MTKLRDIPEIKFAKPITSALDLGKRGELEWIPVSKLLIDADYQRDILEDGKKNIRNIIENFRWSYFTPLVVSKRLDCYAVIDGQHRAVAAKHHGGIRVLPCFVIECSREEEAKAFAVINGNITRPNTLQIYAAKIASGDRAALRLKKICDNAGVKVPRNVGLCTEPGDTLAIGALQRCLEIYGAEILTAALKLVTETGTGNAGFLRAAIIHALCRVLHVQSAWFANPAVLRDTIQKVTLERFFKNAAQIRAVDGGTMQTILFEKIVAATEREVIAREKAKAA